MSADLVIDMLVHALQLSLLIAAPMLGAGLVIGLTISIFSVGYLYSGDDTHFYP